MDSLLRDLRFVLRGLRRSPGFTVIAIVTLALGIGANATVFSILDALLLRPLPVAEPQRLYFIEAGGSRGRFPSHSFPDYLDYKRTTKTFSDIAAYRIAAMGLQTGAGADRAWGYLVTGNYFEMLGVQPALGRFFTPAEDTTPGASPYAVLSFDAWRRRFGGNPRVIGSTIRINGLVYTILGVAPRGFRGTEVAYASEIWVPMSMQPQIEGRSWLDLRTTLNAWVIGRLARSVSPDQATADLNRIAASIAAAYPRSHEGLRLSLARPGFVGNTGRGPVSAFIVALMALAGLVLLAACFNLASLLAARVIDRRREMAIRLTLGATRSSVARHLLTETLVLSVAGGVAGFAIAAAILQLLAQWRLPLPLPVQFEVTPDVSVFLFAAIVTLTVAAGASIAPARRAWTTQPSRLTAAQVPALIGRRWSPRDILLAAQIALCAVLVTACAVSLDNLKNAVALPLGFDTSGVSTVAFDVALAGYTPEDGRQFQRRVLDRVSALPGVDAAAYANSLPLTIDQSNTSAFPEDGDIRPSRSVNAYVYQVSPDYFRVLRTPIVQGRAFSDDDTIDRAAIAVVNRAFVRRVIKTQDPVGRRFRTGPTQFIEVVGVAEDGKYEALSDPPEPTIFRPAAQSYNSTAVLVVRSQRPERDMVREMAAIVTELDPRVPLLSQQSLTDAIAIAFLPARVAGVALTAFGALALALALTGLYGLCAYSVSARLREIGIRTAVGARRHDIIRFVLGRTTVLLGAGSLLGFAASVAANQLLGAVMYHASSREPVVLVAAAAAMALAGLCAAWMPARRALSVDPASTLRDA
ncbi:MAG TPA: ABC transporter permease [Vicinamibacterales bacterium]